MSSTMRLPATLLLAGLLVATTTVFAAENPGLKVAVTQKGLDLVKTKVVPKILTEIGTISIDDQEGVEAGFKYELRDINIAGINFDAATSQIVLNEAQNTVDVTIAGGKVAGSLHFKWYSPIRIVRSGGDADMAFSDGTIKASLAVGAANGKTTLTVKSISVDFKTVNVSVHGSKLALIYNVIVNIAKSLFMKMIEKAVSTAVVGAINGEAAKALATVPYVEPINDFTELSVELTSAPKIATTHFETFHKGLFQWRGHQERIEGTPAVMADAPPTGMLQAYLSEFVGNSMGFVFHNSGELKFLLSPDTLPPDFPIALNTDSFKDLIPGLAEKFPNMPMSFAIKSSSAPTVHLQDQAAHVMFYGVVECYVLPEAGAEENVFTLGGNMKADIGDIHVTGTTIGAAVSAASLGAMTVIKSEVGDINTESLESLVNFAVKLAVLPTLNKILGKGFQIPTVMGIGLSNPKITIAEGYLVVDTDIEYTPVTFGEEGAMMLRAMDVELYAEDAEL